MDFLTVRDFRTSPKKVWQKLSQDGEIVITNNGKPTALLLDIKQGEFEELSQAVRQVKAMRSVNNMRLVAAENGYMGDSEIDNIIQEVRQEIKTERESFND